MTRLAAAIVGADPLERLGDDGFDRTEARGIRRAPTAGEAQHRATSVTSIVSAHRQLRSGEPLNRDGQRALGWTCNTIASSPAENPGNRPTTPKDESLRSCDADIIRHALRGPSKAGDDRPAHAHHLQHIRQMPGRFPSIF